MTKIRVLVADDHAILRDGIRALLTLYDDIEVIGEPKGKNPCPDPARQQGVYPIQHQIWSHRLYSQEGSHLRIS